jgi:hypothetical protein
VDPSLADRLAHDGMGRMVAGLQLLTYVAPDYVYLQLFCVSAAGPRKLLAVRKVARDLARCPGDFDAAYAATGWFVDLLERTGWPEYADTTPV